MSFDRPLVPVLVCAFAFAACGGPSTDDAGADAGGGDGSPPDAAGMDAGPPDLGGDVPCPDADGDGHRALSCGGDDCDDADPNRYPGNPEVCDALDQDCDPATLGTTDADHDGFVSSACCNPTATGAMTCGDDCDDSDPRRHRTAPEVCDGIDNDCNGLLDGPLEDQDHDGHANPACAGTAGDDCDDMNASVYPGAPEVCDGLDDDCSNPGHGTVAGHDTEPTEDEDGDMHAPASAACTSGFPKDDCDDVHVSVHPGAPELCDHLDNDCDGVVDPFPAGACDVVDVSTGYGTQYIVRGNGTIEYYAGRYADVTMTMVLAIDDYRVAGVTNAVAVCNGGTNKQFGCALGSDHTVACWGDNTYGTLGDGTTVTRTTAALVPGLTDAVQLACSDGGDTPFVCARRTGGTISCWGIGTSGELGTGTAASSSTPVAVAGISDAIDVAAGADFACAVRAGGAVWCWGSNTSSSGTTTGVLGRTPAGGFSATAAAMATPAVADATQLALSYANGCALRSTGAVVCWGATISGVNGDDNCMPGTYQNVQLRTCAPGSGATCAPSCGTALSGIVEVDVAGSHACARDAAGQLYCWGSESYAELGDGILSSTRYWARATPEVTNATRLYIGAGGGLVRRSDGTFAEWPVDTTFLPATAPYL